MGRYTYIEKEKERKKNPLSLSYLEDLNEEELLDKKEEFEGDIAYLNAVFDQESYNFCKKKKEKINEVKVAYNELREEFKKLKKNIEIRERYFIKKGFFGGVSTASKATYVLCEKNNITANYIKKLKILCDLFKKHNSKKFNSEVEEFTIQLSRRYRIPITNRPYEGNTNIDYYVVHSFNEYDFLNKIIIEHDKYLEELVVYDKIFHPKKIFSHDEFWTTSCEEVDGDYFKKAKDNYGTLGFLIGSFFKEYKTLINDSHSDCFIQEVIDEDTFKLWKKQILEHLERYLRKTVLVLRSIERNTELSENLNSVYVLSNKSYENIYKVGWTSMLPEERAEQLSSETGVLHPFKVVYKKKFKDAEKTEKKIHKNFNKYRVKRNKEYFEINLDELKDYIDSI